MSWTPLARSSVFPFRAFPLCTRCIRAFTSSRSAREETIASPLAARLRNDLKTALRAKDTARLAVLRSILADITNASKTASPTRTDLQILSLLRKRAQQGRDAAAGFESQGRSDLREKEEGQIAVLEEYAGSVSVLGEREVRPLVEAVVKRLDTPDKGRVMKECLRELGPAGSWEGRNVEKALLANVVADVLSEIKTKSS